MPEKLSVLIPVFNEEKNLPECLESVRGMADEIFVVDSFSTDNTVELAKQFGARVEQHEYVNSAAQKNWAIPRCTHEWVFIIDADERMTPELRAEIKTLLERPGGPELDGYFVVRRNFFLGGEIKHGGWETNDCQRFFRRSMGRYAERDVHADVCVTKNAQPDGEPGKSGRLNAKLIHNTCSLDGLNRYFQRFNRYTTQAAERYHRDGRKPHFWSFILHPAWEFFKMYILKLGFLDGIPGLAVCSFCAFTRFVRYMKLYARIKQGLPPPKTYKEGTTTSRDIDGARDAASGRRGDA
ncbi:MAG TPA: glycosyltransferase family 2 protein [Planctomycetota bacterium]|nr:glycosyltransferase family 2 protein [Planctomycetota bacterium]